MRNPGFVEALATLKPKSFARRIQIYNIKYDPALEQDVQVGLYQDHVLGPEEQLAACFWYARSRTYVPLELTTKAVATRGIRCPN